MSRVLVTGGTGRLGGHLVPLLQAAGHDVRILSRTAGAGRVVGDLADGSGIAAAVAGQEVVVHAASNGRAALEVGGASTLAQAAHRADVQHLVFISVVGAERIPLGYYRAKAAAEQAIRTTGVPATFARSTQWFDLLAAVLGKVTTRRLAVAPRGWLNAPSAVEQFAEFVAVIVGSEPLDYPTQFAGPQTLPVVEIARRWQTAHGRADRVRQLTVPGRLSRALREGAQVLDPSRPGVRGTRTWSDWLAANVG